jgi:hypothetical protein
MPEEVKKAYINFSGTHRGVPYVVHVGPLGSFCGYIRVPDDHPWAQIAARKKTYRLTPESEERTITIGYSDIDIDVHWGLTFAADVKESENWPQGFTDGVWIGWDYAHLGDYVPLLNSHHAYGEPLITHHSTEVEEECRYAIDQMIAAYLASNGIKQLNAVNEETETEKGEENNDSVRPVESEGFGEEREEGKEELQDENL